MFGEEPLRRNDGHSETLPNHSLDFFDLINNSPFTRLIDPSLTFSLTGVATIGNKSFITYRDSRTDQSHLISSEPDRLGREILGIRNGDDGVEVDVSFPNAGKFVLSFKKALFVVYKGLSLNKAEVDKFREVTTRSVMAQKKNEATPERVAILNARMAEFAKRNPEATGEETVNYWVLVNEELGL